MYSLHTHTGISSASRGFSDSSLKLEDLVKTAKELGLKGIAITDHESVGGFVQAKQLEEKYDFPVLCGNEIYLISDEQDDLLRSDYQTGMYYPHFLLLSLDEIGNRQLRELSTIAWMNSYHQGGIIRTPTLMKDVERVIGANKGHVIGSTACFLKGTMVKTTDGFKPIEDVNNGEVVLTHNCNWETVNFPTQRDFVGDIHTIKTQGTSFPIESTDNHKFLTVKKEDYQNYTKYGSNEIYHQEVLPSIYLKNSQMLKKGLSKFVPDWTEAKDLKIGDFLLTPIEKRVEKINSLDFNHIKNKKRSRFASRLQHLNSYNIDITKEFLEVLGLFVADGNFCNVKSYRAINFTFHDEHTHLINKVQDYFNSIGIRVSIHSKKDCRGTSVTVGSEVVYEIFVELFDGVCKAHTKTIPKFIKYIEPKMQMHFLKGYILGDGHISRPVTRSGKRRRNITVATVSKSLAQDLVSLFHRNYINPNMYVVDAKVGNDGVSRREAYYLEINGKIVDNIVPFLLGDKSDYSIDYNFLTQMHIPVIYENKYYMKQKVTSNISKYMETQVHCLNVENDHSFVANGVIAHNCLGSQTSKWIVDILQNQDDKQRVEMRENQIRGFINWCLETFGESNFYLECQPPSYIEGEQQQIQVYVNQYLLDLSKELGVPCIITSDVHYRSKELLPIHSAFLNSKDGGGEREVEEFYATAYLMPRDEVIEYFKPYWSMEDIEKALENTCKIGDRGKRYKLEKKQVIPKIELEDGWKITEGFYPKEYEYINKMINSEHEQDGYLMYLIEKGMKRLIPEWDYKETFD